MVQHRGISRLAGASVCPRDPVVIYTIAQYPDGDGDGATLDRVARYFKAKPAAGDLFRAVTAFYACASIVSESSENSEFRSLFSLPKVIPNPETSAQDRPAEFLPGLSEEAYAPKICTGRFPTAQEGKGHRTNLSEDG